MDQTDQVGPLFRNEKIDRQLSREALETFLDRMCEQEKAEWVDYDAKKKKGTKNKVLIFWKTPEEWADAVWEWVDDEGLNETVCTVYELLHGDTGEKSILHEMDESMFKRIVEELQKRGKAEMFSTDSGNGIKFLK